MSVELIRYQRGKNSGELYATLPNGKCLVTVYKKCVLSNLYGHLFDVVTTGTFSALFA